MKLGFGFEYFVLADYKVLKRFEYISVYGF